MVEVTAIEVALSVVDDRAVRGGLIDFCAEHGIAVIAHSPLGGPRRVRAVARRPESWRSHALAMLLREQVALAWLLELSSVVVPIPGARRPETAVSAAQAAQVRPRTRRPSTAHQCAWMAALRTGATASPAVDDGEVVLIMGVPGAGKSRRAEEFVAHGYVRLNRDERGGSLRQLSDVLERSAGVGRTSNRPRQHVPHPCAPEPRGRERRTARYRRFGASGSTRRSPRLRSILSSACSIGSAPFPHPRQLQRARTCRAGTPQPHKADARLPRARAAVARRGLQSPSNACSFERSPRAPAHGERNAGSRVRGRCGANASGLGNARLRPALSTLLTSSSTGDRTRPLTCSTRTLRELPRSSSGT